MTVQTTPPAERPAERTLARQAARLAGRLMPPFVRHLIHPVPVTLEWTAAEICIRRDGRERREVLPPAFRELNFLNHPVETAEWIRPRLRGFGAPSCIWVLPPGACAVKVLQLPWLNDRELREFLAWEAGQYVPYEADTFYLDGVFRTRREPQEGDSELVLAALPRERGDALEELTARLGLTCVQVDTAAPETGRPLHVNLLPREKRQDGSAKGLAYRAAAVLVLAVTLLHGGWTAFRYVRARDAAATAAFRLTQLAEPARRYRRSQMVTEEIGRRRAALAASGGGQVRWHMILEALSRCIPDTCRLTEVRQETEAFVLRGEALSAEAVQRFAGTLRQHPLFRETVLLETGTGGAAGLQFTLRTVAALPETEPPHRGSGGPNSSPGRGRNGEGGVTVR